MASRKSLHSHGQANTSDTTSWAGKTNREDEHLDILTVEYWVTYCHFELYDDQHSVELWQQVLACRKNCLGQKHPDTVEVAERLHECLEMVETPIDYDAPDVDEEKGSCLDSVTFIAEPCERTEAERG